MPKRAPSDLDTTALASLLREQDGVVGRSQLVALGASRNDLRRMIGPGELVAIHPRVYVNHSGRPTRRQREWAAVLACAPAALRRESALDAHGMTRDRLSPTGHDGPIHLLVDRHRRIVPPSGVTLERVADREKWVQANRRPPRAQLEYALLKAAGVRGDADAIAAAAAPPPRDAGTGPGRCAGGDPLGPGAPLPARRRTGARTARGGTPAPPRHVERRRAPGHPLRRPDLQRDLDAALEDHVTLRPGWAQVLAPCRLAEVVTTILRLRGWTGLPHACRREHCPIGDGGAPGLT